MNFTEGFIVFVLILIFGVDFWLLVKKGYKATVSATLLRWGKDYPVIPFLLGIVMGHLYWNNLAPVKEALEKCGQQQGETP